MLPARLFAGCCKGHWRGVQDALNAGADVGSILVDGYTALHAACLGNSTHVVMRLLAGYKTQIDVNAQCSEGTPLHIACYHGNVDIATVLIEKRADVNALDQFGNTPLHMSCNVGCLLTVNQLLGCENIDINARNSFGDTPLTLACSSSDVSRSIIHRLLNSGADVNIRNNAGWNALHISIQKSSVSIVGNILNQNPNVELADNLGNTPLHWACKKDHIEVVEALLQRGARMNLRNSNGLTPQEVAALSDLLDIVDVLLQAGAELKTNVNGSTANIKRWARKSRIKLFQLLPILCNPFFSISKFYRGLSSSEKQLFSACMCGCWQDVEGAINNWASVRWTSSTRRTALLCACIGDNVHVARRLLTYWNINININDQSSEGTPLHVACLYGHSKVMTELIVRGADVTAGDSCGNTPLHVACANNHWYCAQALLQNGKVEINDQNSSGDTPLTLACVAVCSSVIELLLDSGADVNIRNGKGQSALLVSIETCPSSVVNMILHLNPNVQLADNNNITPLHLACSLGRTDLVKALLGCGVRLNVRDNCGLSPLDTAVKTGSSEITGMLLQAGAVVSTIIHGRGGGTGYLTDRSRTTLCGILQVLFTQNFNISMASQCLEEVCQNTRNDEAIGMFANAFSKKLATERVFENIQAELADLTCGMFLSFFQSVQTKTVSACLDLLL